MSIPLLLVSIAASLPAEPSIIVTGSRESLDPDEAALSASVLEEEAIRAIGLPAAADLLRLTPGIAVATTGPRGTQTQLRIRGAEANHTLLFVDGIRFNDPAAGGEARFELLTADLLSRIEVVRGPQSALWGSEALGGVIAVAGAHPLQAQGPAAVAEYGSLGTVRLLGRHGFASDRLGVVASAGWQSSDGNDSFGGGGERDGFDNFAGRVAAVQRSPLFEIGAVGHWIEGRSEYDGFDSVTFRRADTLDETQNRIGAVRVWAAGGAGGWSAKGEASYLDSTNRNLLGDAPLNRTAGDRLTLAAQLSRRLDGHRMTVAVEHGEEDFRARDTAFSGTTNQDRSRSLTAFAAEWRAEWSEALTTDVAIRHDAFSAFADATTLRAALLVEPVRGWTLHAAYGEGVAQPTFYDLYGFFPGSFVGNPDLQPERSRGWEAGLRWRNENLSIAVTGFSSRLRDEIVDVFDPATFLSTTDNAGGTSRRRGFEAAVQYRGAGWLTLAANYTFLDAEEQTVAAGTLVREPRRPRHSASLIAFGASGRLSWGASLAFVGARRDTDFDPVPARSVRLDDYALASLNVAFRLLPQLELFARVENGFDADYQDVVGFNTPGRTVHAGVRFAAGR